MYCYHEIKKARQEAHKKRELSSKPRSSDKTFCDRIVIFHKKADPKKGPIDAMDCRIAIQTSNIRIIEESHIDGTTLIKTRKNGVITIAEPIAEAVKIWREA